MSDRSPAQNTVEYALIIAVVGLLVLVGAGVWGDQLRGWLLHLVGRITTT